MQLAVALGSAILLGLAGACAHEQKPPPDQTQPDRQQMPMGQGMMENYNKMMENHLQQRQQRSN